ncbi:hypothetical protein [Dactylosporangium salmoneum]|uniref:Uncharacterized protein n=1 Tax=Dactylosporangium salmoneum TaxID=53361 RepID=A0ABN3GDT0_9ACTN
MTIAVATVDLAAWGWADRIESVQFTRGSGAASFLEEGAVPLFTVDAGNPAVSDVGAARNRARVVYIAC